MAPSLGFYRSLGDFLCTILAIHRQSLVLLTHLVEIKASLRYLEVLLKIVMISILFFHADYNYNYDLAV